MKESHFAIICLTQSYNLFKENFREIDKIPQIVV